MAIRLEYTKAHLLSALHDQLIAAGFRPSAVEGEDPDHPFKLYLTFEDDSVDQAAVAAVVTAHDRAAALAAWQAARQAERDDDSAVRQAIASLTTDADSLVALATELEGAGALTTAQLRARMGLIARGVARTDRYLAGLARVVARRT